MSVSTRKQVGRFEKEMRWVKRGRQRQAVMEALYKPMIGIQIVERARKAAPRIRLRDLWLALRQLTEKELTYCLTPRLVNGKVYFMSDRGRAALAASGQRIGEAPAGIDWDRYGQVARAKLRRLLLQELARPSSSGKAGKTASEIRKGLRDRHSAGLNPIFRTLADLTHLGLVRPASDSERNYGTRYVLTPMGRRIAAEMQR